MRPPKLTGQVFKMDKFKVRIIRTITTFIEVEAETIHAAREYVKNYSPVSLAADGKVISEDDVATFRVFNMDAGA